MKRIFSFVQVPFFSRESIDWTDGSPIAYLQGAACLSTILFFFFYFFFPHLIFTSL